MASIVETAMQSGQFNTLVTALQAAGLVETLKGSGPFTVFAPSDSAFAKLPPEAIEGVLNDMPRLKSILMYHVVMGEYMAEDVIESDQLITAQGESIMVDTSQGVRINNANVIQTDIEADNGVIHVIDTVLMPKVQSMV